MLERFYQTDVVVKEMPLLLDCCYWSMNCYLTAVTAVHSRFNANGQDMLLLLDWSYWSIKDVCVFVEAV